MSQIEKTTDILNDLVKINNDRIEGYERAISEAKDTDADLKTTFSSMVSQSKQYRQELASLVASMGEEPAEGTRMDGKIYRAWMDVKATFSGNSRKSVLENCEFGEDAAQKAYKTALSSNGDLTPEARAIIERERQGLKASHDAIKQMRDAA